MNAPAAVSRRDRLLGMHHPHPEDVSVVDQALHLYHNKRHPAQMGPPEIREFLSHLATQHHVAVNTQKAALNSLAFFGLRNG